MSSVDEILVVVIANVEADDDVDSYVDVIDTVVTTDDALLE